MNDKPQTTIKILLPCATVALVDSDATVEYTYWQDCGQPSVMVQTMSANPDMTNPIDVRLRELLLEKGVSECPTCGRKIDRGDISWNDGQTDAGTQLTFAQIHCQQCQTEVARWSSWYSGGNSDLEEFVENVLPDLEAKKNA